MTLVQREPWLDFFDRWVTAPAFGEGAFIPAVDIRENSEQFELKAELPGIAANEVEVKVDEQMLHIKGEKKQDDVNGEKNIFSLKECLAGRFVRSFRLPDTVNTQKIRAKYAQGVLTVFLPKREERKPQIIAVEAA